MITCSLKEDSNNMDICKQCPQYNNCFTGETKMDVMTEKSAHEMALKIFQLENLKGYMTREKYLSYFLTYVRGWRTLLKSILEIEKANVYSRKKTMEWVRRSIGSLENFYKLHLEQVQETNKYDAMPNKFAETLYEDQVKTASWYDMSYLLGFCLMYRNAIANTFLSEEGMRVAFDKSIGSESALKGLVDITIRTNILGADNKSLTVIKNG